MKLDCVLTAVNENHLYLDFIPLFVKTWKKLYPKVDVKIIFIGNNNILNRKHDFPSDFDWKFYLDYYKDLRDAGLKTEIDSFYKQCEISSDIIGLRNAAQSALVICIDAKNNKKSIGCHYLE